MYLRSLSGLTASNRMSKLIPYHGILVREDNPADKTVIKQCLKNYSRFTFDENSKVLDLGVFVGGFGVMALEKNVAAYLGVEADKENLAVAEQNLLKYGKKAEILFGAASASDAETLTFYQTDSAQKYNCGTIAVDSRNKGHRPIRVDVPNHSIDKLIAQFSPSHLKMDIEGAENDWLAQNEGVVHPCVKEFALEVHRGPKIAEFAQRALPRILEDFELVYCDPMIAFSAVSDNVIEIPLLNIKTTGTLMAVDLFFRRK